MGPALDHIPGALVGVDDVKVVAELVGEGLGANLGAVGLV
jgi:hypothetical protein